MSSDLTRPSAPQGATPPGAQPRPLDDPATLRALVVGLREGLYVTDAEGRVLDANPAFAALVGAAARTSCSGVGWTSSLATRPGAPAPSRLSASTRRGRRSSTSSSSCRAAGGRRWSSG
jgi:PAS domain-containing protein